MLFLQLLEPCPTLHFRNTSEQWSVLLPSNFGIPLADTQTHTTKIPHGCPWGGQVFNAGERPTGAPEKVLNSQDPQFCPQRSFKGIARRHHHTGEGGLAPPFSPCVGSCRVKTSALCTTERGCHPPPPRPIVVRMSCFAPPTFAPLPIAGEVASSREEVDAKGPHNLHPPSLSPCAVLCLPLVGACATLQRYLTPPTLRLFSVPHSPGFSLHRPLLPHSPFPPLHPGSTLTGPSYPLFPGSPRRVKRSQQRLDCIFGKRTLPIGSKGRRCDRRGGGLASPFKPRLRLR